MFIAISPLNPDPMYKQVMDQIKDAIADGGLKPEVKLPSIRQMSQELKISPITIKRAYADLETEGYIYTRPGLGCFVADINKDNLKMEKLEEIKTELTKLIRTGKRFNISREEIIKIIREIMEENDG